MYSCRIINIECIFLILRTRNAWQCLATEVDVECSESHSQTQYIEFVFNYFVMTQNGSSFLLPI